MDRVTAYPGALIAETDPLKAQQNAMIALGWASQSTLGTATAVDGFALTPTLPASLVLNLAPGAIYQVGATEATVWSSLPSNSAALVKQGLMTAVDPISFSPPGATGFSQAFLIEAQYADLDTSPVLLPYYNAANPNQPYSGPGGNGQSQNTARLGIVAIQVKAGTAVSGTPTIPTPDAGWVGLYVVTLSAGATSISSGNISVYPGAPFIPVKLPAVPAGVQSGAWVTATVSGTNALTATLNPAPTAIASGFEFHFLPQASNTGAVTMSIAGLGTWPVVVGPNTSLIGGELIKSRWSRVIFDGARFQIGNTSPGIGTTRTRAPSNIDLYVTSSGSDVTGDGLTQQTAWATPQKAWDTLQRNYDITGVIATIHCSGAFTSGVVAQGPIVGSQNPGSVVFQGAGSGTTSISATNSSCFSAQSGAIFTVSGFTLSATGTASGQGAALYTTPGGILVFGSDMIFGACDVAHTFAQGGQISSNSAPYTISGAAQAHLDAQLGGIITVSAPVTLTGTPTFFLAYAVAAFYGLVYAGGSSFSGSAIGSRYSTSSGAIIVNGGGVNFLPGSLGGIANAPGFYL